VTPAARRDAVRRARRLGMTERRACGLIGIQLSMRRRKPRRGDPPGGRETLLRLAEERPRLRCRRLRAPVPPASRPKECWSMDFTLDALASGRVFRTLNVVYVVTRMRLSIEVDTSLRAARVVRVLDRPAAAHGRPRAIAVDNGTEFTARATDA